ncbi:NAD(P)/FAD-dependent oxidoreductase [Rudanella lutea]|uniref:NAD(P)/FAD-dependent oxidoreductase n=1 Tax=Rudanella lutea TaxID=451374 RepID=UPI00036F5067|nr:FAD-dependent oxidoreductase [Rudanella lutea]
MKPRVVIVGAGHGGIQAAASLREEGFEGDITLLSEDPALPYQKPPLSKGYLQGKQTDEAILFRSATWYTTNQIDLRLGVSATHLDPATNQLTTSTGDTLTYTHLILATGAANRRLPMPGADEVLYLRTLADARQIGDRLAQAKRVAIIGGGFIGLELAAVAVEKGKEVTVVEYQPRLMQRVLPPVISDVFGRTHQQHGVGLRLGVGLQAIQKQGHTHTLTLTDGQSLTADLVVAGIGVIAETGLAASAGLVCEDGIRINEYGQTSVATIYAIGDCAAHDNPFAGKCLRLESVQNAVDQAKTVVSHLLGNPRPYRAVPWFWTNQYHLKLQMAGISAGFDTYLIRGDEAAEKFSVYYFKGDKLLAVDSLNRPADHLNARKLLEAGITPTEAQITDLSFNLNGVL